MKVPQKPDGCPVPRQRVDKVKGERAESPSSSASSESESSSEPEGSSEEVSLQLANLEERVGTLLGSENGIGDFAIHFSASYSIVFSVESS